MSPTLRLGAVLFAVLVGLVAMPSPTAAACTFERCPATGLDGGAATVGWDGGPGVAALVAGDATRAVAYAWRLRTLCVLSDEANGDCSGVDFRQCPQEPGRVIGFFVIQRRPIVQATPEGDLMVAEGSVPPGAQVGQQVGSWIRDREGCLDITPLNPPPSGAEVFSYFERLPLPQLTTQHQPPGDGLTGLPVIFYTDSPTTQNFTVDIRGFSVVIEATAERFTWHTGDATGEIVSTDPGRPYPDQTIEHSYRSGTYTAHLTVTWGATFTVNGSAPADVPGTTTTDGPPVTFDVLRARPVLTNPYD
jgi:hypothetical protein